MCLFLGISTDRLKIVSGSNVATKRFLQAATTNSSNTTESDSQALDTFHSEIYPSANPNYSGTSSNVDFIIDYNQTFGQDPFAVQKVLKELANNLNEAFKNNSIDLGDVKVQQMVYTVKVAKDLNGTLITIGDVDPNDPNGN